MFGRRYRCEEPMKCGNSPYSDGHLRLLLWTSIRIFCIRCNTLLLLDPEDSLEEVSEAINTNEKKQVSKRQDYV